MASCYPRKGKWIAWWIDETGKRCSETMTTKEAGKKYAAKKQADADLKRAGLIDPFDESAQKAARTPIDDLVSAYGGSIREKGATERHARQIESVLIRLFASVDIRATSDIDATKLEKALAKIRQAKRSARTRNHAKSAAVAFCAWLWNRGHIKTQVRGLDELGHQNQEASRVRVRRALTAEEFDRLITATETGPTVTLSKKGQTHVEISGRDRAMLYRIAAHTGLRANEVRTLTPQSFDLSDKPAVTINAENAKNRRKAVQPITRAFAGLLRDWLADRPADAPVVPVPEKTAKLLRADLKRAGIPVTDSRGRVVDFHALRVYYITDMFRRGVPVSTARVLARHSDANLTLKTYTDLGDEKLREALDE